MTIITKPITGDRKDEKDTKGLVEESKIADDTSINVPADEEVENISGPEATAVLRGAAAMSQLCLLLTAIVALSVGVMGGLHMYRSMTTRHFMKGICRMPYPRSSEETLISGDFGAHTPDGILKDKHANPLKMVSVTQLKGEKMEIDEKLRSDGTIEFDYKLDLDYDEYEEFELPDLSYGRYLHDFKVNKTAIIDPAGKRCFVFPLDRNEISPPKSLMDIITKMKDGAFELDIDEIRHDTRVVLPPISNLDSYGFFISRSCAGRTTYRLEEVTKRVVKRSAVTNDKFQFAEFGGKAMIKYNIVNLNEI